MNYIVWFNKCIFWIMKQSKTLKISDPTGPRINVKRTSIGNPIVEIRRSYDRLISTMEFPIWVRWHLYIESGALLWHLQAQWWPSPRPRTFMGKFEGTHFYMTDFGNMECEKVSKYGTLLVHNIHIKTSILTHCGLVTPYVNNDLGQHWLM